MLKCTHSDIRPAARKFVPLLLRNQGKLRREVSPESCGGGFAQENPHDQLRISRRACSRESSSMLCEGAMGCKRCEVGVLKRRFQRACTWFRRCISDDARVDAIASMCCIAYEMLLPERR